MESLEGPSTCILEEKVRALDIVRHSIDRIRLETRVISGHNSACIETTKAQFQAALLHTLRLKVMITIRSKQDREESHNVNVTSLHDRIGGVQKTLASKLIKISENSSIPILS